MTISRRLFPLLVAVTVLAAASLAHAQNRPDPAKTLAAQREALAKLAWMDGTWRGTAWRLGPDGQKHEMTQTERVGPFLDGALRVIEGRGYEPDGKPAFNAFGVVSFDSAKGAYTLRSHAQGNAGDFVLTLTADGYSWEIPAGPVTVRYTAALKDGVWTETGERIAAGKDPVVFFGMSLKRLGATDWPAAGAVGPQ